MPLVKDGSRWAVFVFFDGKGACNETFQEKTACQERNGREKYVIKIASNGFTTRERVDMWADMIAEYGRMGYYSPAIRKSLAGNYSESAVFRGRQCVVWEEEYAKYCLRETLDKSVYMGKDGRYVYHDEVLEFLGRTAQMHFHKYSLKSGWVRFEPFDSSDETDEVTECVRTFDRIVREKAPGFTGRWERILALFEANKKELLKVYHKLPTSFFQADSSGDNLVLDEKGHFKGVIDYNLSGSDVVINIFLSEILFAYSYHRRRSCPPDALPELNDDMQDSLLEIIRDSFSYLGKFYDFSRLELEAAPLLLKYITCIEYAQVEALKKYIHDNGKLNLLFDFMEKDITRCIRI